MVAPAGCQVWMGEVDAWLPDRGPDLSRRKRDPSPERVNDEIYPSPFLPSLGRVVACSFLGGKASEEA